MAERKLRLLALLVFRNEMRYLPDYFANITPHVDGIVALDDGSTDSSTEFVGAQASVLKVIHLPSRTPHVWDEPRNRRMIIETSWRYSPDWLVALDADERVEIGFRERAEHIITEGERDGILAWRVKLPELWDRPDTIRVDGMWGNKSNPRLFKARRDHVFSNPAFHGFWTPLNSMIDGDYPLADLYVYHLRMMRYWERLQRRDRYKALDPNNEWQSFGYDYMTDERGLRVRRIPADRRFEPHPPELELP